MNLAYVHTSTFDQEAYRVTVTCCCRADLSLDEESTFGGTSTRKLIYNLENDKVRDEAFDRTQRQPPAAVDEVSPDPLYVVASIGTRSNAC